MIQQKNINGFPFQLYQPEKINAEQAKLNIESLLKQSLNRRTVRDFSSKPLSKKLINNIISIASTAPSGANKQPWMFCAITNPSIKKEIRIQAEEEEKLSYTKRMPKEWLQDLLPLQTNWQKPFLETAPCLIVVFKKSYDFDKDGKKTNVYYANESCGLACGFLLHAIQEAGLVALTHTPSPMNFLSKILNRPENEKPYLLIPIGYPTKNTWVPVLTKKTLPNVLTWY